MGGGQCCHSAEIGLDLAIKNGAKRAKFEKVAALLFDDDGLDVATHHDDPDSDVDPNEARYESDSEVAILIFQTVLL
jgi:hypothetical protein